jgi:DNA-binding response OmpR family regulator
VFIGVSRQNALYAWNRWFSGVNDETPSLFTSIQAMKKGAFDALHLPIDMKKLTKRVTATRQRQYERENAKKTEIQCNPQYPNARQ